MKFPIFGSSDDDPGAGPTYAYVCNHGLVNWNSDQAIRVIALSEDCWVSEFTVTLTTAPGSGKSRTYTIMKDTGDTIATVTISDTATTATWTGAPVFFGEGSGIKIKQTGSGTPAAPGATHWSMFLNTTGNKCFIMGGTDGTPSNTSNTFACPFGTTNSNVVNNQNVPVPTNGTLTKAWVHLQQSPDFGNSWDISLRVNNTTDLLTCNFQDLAEDQSATGSSALAPGDDIQMKFAPTSTPLSTYVSWCYTFEPDINGESFYGYGTVTALSATNTQYQQPIGQGNAWSTTESNEQLRLPGCSYKKLYVEISVAPGTAKSRTFTMRDNGADSTLTVTISGASALAGNDTTHTVTHTAGQTIGLKSVPTLTPAAASCHFAYVIVTTQPPGKARSLVY